MNKIVLIVIVLCVMYACDSGRENVSNGVEDSEIVVYNSNVTGLPDRIKDLPLKIEVINEPDTIFAQIHDKDTNRFIWKHTTLVKSLESNIQIIEFGTYNYRDGEWLLGNFTKKPFTAKEFEAWYFRRSLQDIISWEQCKDAYLIEGEEYVDPSNWSITQDSLVERSGLWYYIGINDQGEKVAGYARYYAAPEVLN